MSCVQLAAAVSITFPSSKFGEDYSDFRKSFALQLGVVGLDPLSALYTQCLESDFRAELKIGWIVSNFPS